MGPTDHKTNQFEVCSDLLDVSWTSRWEEPEVIARRSAIQRSRHAEDAFFHETALRNLEKGRLNEWKEERILEAIRSFYDRMGRAPRYGAKQANDLPDYKTIWRKFGSSRIAISKALNHGSEE